MDGRPNKAMASNQPSTSNSTTTVHTVRVPRDRSKRFRMMKFSTGADIDFVRLSQTPVRLERENNLKEYKSAYDIDQMPKFGAGSEYGREQKEEARRKKYGIQIKKYNPEDQPYVMKIGKSKEIRKFKGVREGTITDNTSYYIFTQSANNVFEAIPVEEWYTFSPMIRYKYLNSEEAEEEFNRRDKTMNLFSVMVRNRIRNDEDNEAGPDEEEKVKTKTKSKKEKSSFYLTEDDELGEGDDDEDEEDGREEDDDEDSKPKSKGKKGGGKSKRTSKRNSDDEAVEESDEGDFDDKEVDYITDSSSEEELEDREKKDTYEEKGVAEEHGLRKLIDSEDESEEEEEDKKSDKEEEEGEGENKDKKGKKKKDGSDSSSSSSSDSDSDIERDETLSSAIFMQKQKDRKSPVPPVNTGGSGDAEDKKAAPKRKIESEEMSSKKMRTESPSLAGSSSAGITEDAIRRYLTRKPMTAKELLAKFSSKRLSMTKEQMITTLGTLLKKINPEKKKINEKLYFILKKPE